MTKFSLISGVVLVAAVVVIQADVYQSGSGAFGAGGSYSKQEGSKEEHDNKSVNLGVDLNKGSSSSFSSTNAQGGISGGGSSVNGYDPYSAGRYPYQSGSGAFNGAGSYSKQEGSKEEHDNKSVNIGANLNKGSSSTFSNTNAQGGISGGGSSVNGYDPYLTGRYPYQSGSGAFNGAGSYSKQEGSKEEHDNKSVNIGANLNKGSSSTFSNTNAQGGISGGGSSVNGYDPYSTGRYPYQSGSGAFNGAGSYSKQEGSKEEHDNKSVNIGANLNKGSSSSFSSTNAQGGIAGGATSATGFLPRPYQGISSSYPQPSAPGSYNVPPPAPGSLSPAPAGYIYVYDPYYGIRLELQCPQQQQVVYNPSTGRVPVPTNQTPYRGWGR